MISEILKKLFGYWEVWHLALAMILFMLLFNWLDKQLCAMIVMGVAVLWEIVEYIREQPDFPSYDDVRHFKINALKDLLAALLGVIVCISLL